MRLKSIKLAGFKSFVDPTTVNFPSNLSAIVGPNGCGKSNVIDAVRWVMGESSAKHLRGESMTDVIFNGSQARKPIGQASIELVFDNGEGKLRGQYAGFAEVATKRLVTRDGQSHYFLNGVKCRRRDITDLFLGTGLGPRSYAIIEQGMISRLIDAKPHELRVYIEEAAGISKYKERRKETESRMNRTRENLERLLDIRDELDRQLQHLKRQANAAERYKEYKESEREYRAQLWALNWKALATRKDELDQALRTLELEQEAQVTERVRLESATEIQREQHTELSETYQTRQQRFYELGAQIPRLEQPLKHPVERESQITQELTSSREQLAQLEQRRADDADSLEHVAAESMELEPELELVQAEADDNQERLEEARMNVQASQDAWDAFSARAAEPQAVAQGEQSKIDQLETSMRRLNDRLERLQLEASELDGRGVESELEEFAAQMDVQSAVVAEQEGRRGRVLDELDTVRASNRELSDRLNQLRDTLQTEKGRFASLEALQQAALNPTDHSQWLNDNNLSDARRLGEDISAQSGWELALETVLGTTLQALVVDRCDALAHTLNEVSAGNLTLVDASAHDLKTAATQCALPALADCVQPASAAHYVSGIFRADTLHQALEARSQLAAHESIITQDGLWVGPNWIRVHRGDDTQGSVIERQQQLDQLVASIDQHESEVDSLSSTLESGREQLSELEAEREECQQALALAQKELSNIKSQHHAKEIRLEQIQHRCERLESDIQECQEQMAEEHELVKVSRAKLEVALEQMATDSDERERLQSERDERRQTLQTVQEAAHGVTQRLHALSLQHSQLTSRREALEGRLADASTQMEHLKGRCSQLEEQMAALMAVESDDENGQQLEHLLHMRSEAEEHMTEAKRAMDEVGHTLRQIETDRHTVEVTLERVRGELEQQRLKRQSVNGEQQALEHRLQEVEIELDVVLDALPDDASVEQWESELERLATRIARLGPINLAAIDEYESQSERKVYLDRQHDDLTDALNTLESAIRKIDKETRARFKETFDRVNAGLQHLFPKVFGGGEAWLDLTGDDLLDTGVAIMARPPGKKNSTIHLLSGGEKALTAIALVFSIFQLNPAPFCMLDEVDAPLDDANVGRYCRLVSEMSSSVQFIYITHNKIAMEMAHQLMGVTMHEPGVSRLVSVDVDEAAQMVTA